MKRLLVVALLLALAGCATLEKGGDSGKSFKKNEHRHSEHRH